MESAPNDVPFFSCHFLTFSSFDGRREPMEEPSKLEAFARSIIRARRKS